jgi:Ca2+/Na+ antiporter
VLISIKLEKEKQIMIETIILVLVVLWLLGFIFDTAGYYIHLLLIVALAVLVIRFISGRKTV